MMKWTPLVLLTLMCAFAVGCKTTSGDFCDLNSPYRPEAGKAYSKSEKRWITSFNEYGEQTCGWRP